jgi:hypothetical protein
MRSLQLKKGWFKKAKQCHFTAKIISIKLPRLCILFTDEMGCTNS